MNTLSPMTRLGYGWYSPVTARSDGSSLYLTTVGSHWVEVTEVTSTRTNPHPEDPRTRYQGVVVRRTARPAAPLKS